MTDTDNRGLLRVIKVPFDIKAIFLGGLGYIVLIAGGWIFDAAFSGIRDGTHVIARFVLQGLDACSVSLGKIPLIGTQIARVCGTLYGQPCRALDWWEMLLAGIWFLLIMSVFGGAICRVIALRISRDESTGAKEALRFSATNILSYLYIPVFLGLAIAFFVGCNALAGLVSSIPYVGPLLFIVLYPLEILSAIIILLIAVGGLLGLFMMVSAVSTEKNGTLDAISRAFSYIYSRPVAFFFYYFLVFLVASIIILIGHDIFLGTNQQPGILVTSFTQGTLDNDFEGAYVSGVVDALKIDLPGFEHPVTGKGVGWNGIGTFVAWLFTIILKIGVLGFVVTYILGGTTAIYFALRRDVDGTEDSEIYVEGMEDEEDFGLPPVTPSPAPETPAAEEMAEEPKAEEPAPAAEEKVEEPAAEEEEAPAEEEPAAEEEEAPAEEEPAAEEEEEAPAEGEPAAEEEEPPAEEEPKAEEEEAPADEEKAEEPAAEEEEAGEEEDEEEKKPEAEAGDSDEEESGEEKKD